ncbi:helix-turn-helix transcriptional regulator [Staphylococcus haemolyticus]|uniref:helix-turn-helix domain-containing protein n=1 Tax=Staphylococcus haemolyticus TaxID=1283 RepID=UPI002DBEE54A|nr:helix-turn-helix transcriptional regulator [Staphylococcus haemolyticus]MEB5827170.1 helix-turn-helix transcriptional regulator [Staphylococcus haemolyticus]
MYAIIKKEKVMIKLDKLGLNHSEFSNKVGITRSYFSQIYNGRKTSISAAEKIADALGGNIEDHFKLYVNEREINFV